MKQVKPFYFLFLGIFWLLHFGCEQDLTVPASTYERNCKVSLNPNEHPKTLVFQDIVRKHVQRGIVGASVYLKDAQGEWTGAAGKADLASDVDLKPCHRFMIASCSKTLTATAIFLLQDQGKLSIQDPVSKYLDAATLRDIERAREVNIAQLLSHTSGIADFYSPKFELDRINIFYNGFSQSDLLEYARGRSPVGPIGSYNYANVNYLLLGLIIEKATGQNLANAFQTLLIQPYLLNHTGFEFKRPKDLVRGYYPNFSNTRLIESENLYGDELGSADGGFVSTARDIGHFLTMLSQKQILSENSWQAMTNWFDINPIGEYQQTRNGFGLEYHETDFGVAFGHAGAADGFYSIMHYFPDKDFTLVILTNGMPVDNFDFFRVDMYNELLSEMSK